MSTTPLVDILMPTYNHERFIAQAIESVLAQKTTFEYRIMVGDDCSTDSTQAIVKSYVEKHPGKIELFSSPINLGALHRDRMSVKVLNTCTAKYVALLEGDDYWTDPYKLQKQVDFLERHPECSLCFHNAEALFDDGAQPPSYSYHLHPAGQKEISTLVDVINGLVPITCSVLFRNNLIGELPECFYQVKTPDWIMFVLLAELGNFGYINEVMAVYRLHAGGIWSSLNQPYRIRQHIYTYKMIDTHLNLKYHHLISKQIQVWRETLSNECRKHARSCLDQYHSLVGTGEIKKGLQLLLEATHSAPLEVIRPRRFLAVLKNGLLGFFYKDRAQN